MSVTTNLSLKQFLYAPITPHPLGSRWQENIIPLWGTDNFSLSAKVVLCNFNTIQLDLTQ